MKTAAQTRHAIPPISTDKMKRLPEPPVQDADKEPIVIVDYRPYGPTRSSAMQKCRPALLQRVNPLVDKYAGLSYCQRSGHFTSGFLQVSHLPRGYTGVMFHNPRRLPMP